MFLKGLLYWILKGYWTKSLSNPIDWNPKTPYCRGDKIKYGHLRFSCRVGHESSSSFKEDVSGSVSLNNLVVGDYNLRRFYTSRTDQGLPQEYSLGQVVAYQGISYTCVSAHTIDLLDGTSDSSLAQIESTAPGYGSDWQTYWEYSGQQVSASDTRWGGGKVWSEKDLVKVRGIYYFCIQSYSGLDLTSMDLYEPGFGSSYRSVWEIFSRWELISTRDVFAPGWASEIPYLSDYFRASEETHLSLIDYPLIRLGSIRDLGAETEPDTLAKSIEMLGYPMPGFNEKLIKSGTLHLYAASLSRYNDDSGTKFFLNFLNFITEKPTSIIGGLDQYVRCDTTAIGDRSHPEKSNWSIKELYTRDYQTFWTREELLIMLGFKSGYQYLGIWGVDLVISATNTVLYEGWLWTANSDSLNSVPSTTNPDWILTCFIPVDYVNSFDNTTEFLDGSAENPWDPSSPLYLRNGADYSNQPISEQTAHGFYKTSRVYLYRTDKCQLIGKDLEIENPDWSGISKLFYTFAPANLVIYIKELGYDYTFSALIFQTIGRDKSEIEECGYIPFICTTDTGRVVKYPNMAAIDGWEKEIHTVNRNLNILENFVPELDDKLISLTTTELS
jgi:hypothetical protein